MIHLMHYIFSFAKDIVVVLLQHCGYFIEEHRGMIGIILKYVEVCKFYILIKSQ
jgi:hypothetical protein